MGSSHTLWQREQTLEEIRQQQFPAKPSRLASTFCCTNLDTARFYMNVPALQGNRATLHPVLYEVEKVNPYAIEHIADFNVIQPLPGRPDRKSVV